jgi:hypothetical protein
MCSNLLELFKLQLNAKTVLVYGADAVYNTISVKEGNKILAAVIMKEFL